MAEIVRIGAVEKTPMKALLLIVGVLIVFPLWINR